MSQQENQACDACGVTAEMGYVIVEGDDVAQVSIFAENKVAALEEFKGYMCLAKQINENVLHDLDENSDFPINPLVINVKFECSAEKLIFELRSRSLAKTI